MASAYSRPVVATQSARYITVGDDRHGASERQKSVPDGKHEAVLRVFVGADGRWARIPAKRSKRLVLLDRLAQRFEPGEVYTESEVNGIVRSCHDDHAAVRRHLVDEGFLDRRDGFYSRCGGTVDV